MKIQTLIDPARIHLDLEAEGLGDALALVSRLTARELNVSDEVIVEKLLEREALGSTSIGGGFAIPHCKLPGIGGIVITLARFREPIPFGKENPEPVRFLFVVLSPPDHPALHLQALSQIARTLKSERARQLLLEAPDSSAIIDILERVGEGETL